MAAGRVVEEREWVVGWEGVVLVLVWVDVPVSLRPPESLSRERRGMAAVERGDASPIGARLDWDIGIHAGSSTGARGFRAIVKGSRGSVSLCTCM